MSWVYEEELFSDYNAIWFSSAKQSEPLLLAYFKLIYFTVFRYNLFMNRFHEEDVPIMSIPMYKMNESYPEMMNIRYPKVN